MTNNQPINYLEFNNPIHIVWRSGKPDDPFVDRLDISQVVNQRISLLEIPDELYRVRIANMFEINYDKFIKDSLAYNEFYCDYTNGFVYFNREQEAQTIALMYKGRGVILYPSTRIIHYDGNDSYTSMHEIIESSKQQIAELIYQTSNFKEVLEDMIIATNITRNVSDESVKTTEIAKQHIELIKDAYETTVMIYKPYVDTVDDIRITYPSPDIGWTTMVYETGIRYRWDGLEWIPIDAVGGSTPTVTEFFNGLMSKEEHVKLRDISEKVNERVVIFFIKDDILQGVQSPHQSIPFDCEVVGVSATVAKKGLTDTTFEVQVSKDDFETWQSVTYSPILIESGNHRDNKDYTIDIKELNEYDVLRLYVHEFNSDAQDLTVSVKIKTK